MDIVNFFENVAGTWFSQRTTHCLPAQTSHTGQTVLEMTTLESTAATVAQICQQGAVAPSQVLVALQVTYEGGTPSTLVILEPEPGNCGQFLNQRGTAPITQGSYTLADEVLTLSSTGAEGQIQERLWYMNPNLRMRTCLVDQADGSQLATFCSEIRRGVTRTAS